MDNIEPDGFDAFADFPHDDGIPVRDEAEVYDGLNDHEKALIALGVSRLAYELLDGHEGDDLSEVQKLRLVRDCARMMQGLTSSMGMPMPQEVLHALELSVQDAERRAHAE